MQQREQRERDRALAARQAEQQRQVARALEKKKWDIHEQFQASLPALYNDAAEYDELRLQYHEAVPLFFERLDSRQNALDQIARNGAHYTTKTYQLNCDVVALLREYNHSTNNFSTCFGNQYQHVIHEEALDIVDTTAQLSKQSTTYAYRDVLVDFATGICGYVRSGYVNKATQIANFCWTFLDYGKSALEGAVAGAISTINCVADHPVEIALYPIAGKYILAYQLGKILYNVADIGITALTDTTRAKKQWDDYISPITDTISSIKTTRDAIKITATVAVSIYLQSKILGTLGTMYGKIKDKAINFINSNPKSTPKQYL